MAGGDDTTMYIGQAARKFLYKVMMEWMPHDLVATYVCMYIHIYVGIINTCRYLAHRSCLFLVQARVRIPSGRNCRCSFQLSKLEHAGCTKVLGLSKKGRYFLILLFLEFILKYIFFQSCARNKSRNKKIKNI
jgi:hypothetical protein